jgi:hypothetical protein
MIAVAVNGFVTDASLKTLSDVTGSESSMFESP